MVITDLVHRDIREHIASHAPERGGAIYGPRGFPFVTHFEYDPNAQTTSASYVPSRELIDSVVRVERESGLQFKGIVHSHPRGFTRPSGGDEATVASFFRLNPHLSAMALPIVQAADGDADFIHWYSAERRAASARSAGLRNGPLPLPGNDWSPGGILIHPMPDDTVGVQVIAEDFHVVPLAAHVERIVEGLAAAGADLSIDPKPRHVRLRNAELVGLVAQGAGGREFMYFVSLDYPAVAPVVLYQRDGATELLESAWNGLSQPTESVDRVTQALKDAWLLNSSEEFHGGRNGRPHQTGVESNVD